MESARNKSLLTVLALMLAASMAASRVGEPTLASDAGVRRPLPARFGRWTGHALFYCANPDCAEAYGADDIAAQDGQPVCPLCGSQLDTMAPIERHLLPEGTEILRSLYRGPDGAPFFVSVVISGRDRLSLHRPENCLPGQGLSIRGSRILETPIENGAPLRTRLLDVRRQIGGSDAAVHSYFTYWYVGQGRETPSQWQLFGWMAADRLLHARMDRWAYVAVAYDVNPSQPDAGLQALRDFLAALQPVIVVP